MKANEFDSARWLQKIGLLTISTVAIVLCSMATAPPAAAATFTVSTTADSGPGSLRAAIAAAQQTTGPNDVEFAHGVRGTIVLTSGAIVINQSVTIAGPGAHRLAISGNDADRIFDIEGGTAINVSISGLRIKHGLADSSSSHGSAGGAIYISGATVMLAGVVLTRNQAIDSLGSTAEGGAIALVGGASVSASDLTAKHNRARTDSNGAASGGGFFVDPVSSLSLTDSLVTLNEALGNPGVGGGVYTVGTFTRDVSTSITGNTASTSGNDVGP